MTAPTKSPKTPTKTRTWSHLVALGLGEGADGGTTGGDTSEATNPGQCDTLNAGCTAGEAEDALYTGDEIVIIGDTKEQQFYYHPDHLGSTAYITDSSGQLTEHLEYFPFGETWVQEGGSKKTPYLYTGKELDQETGLYYYGARYYDPRVSVWASPDPILEKYLDGFVGGVYVSSNLSLFTYGRNSPVVLKDPDGNFVPLIGAAVAATVDTGMQLGLIAVGAETEFSWSSVGVSAVAGATGVGLGALAAKAGRFDKAASLAADAVTSAGSTVAKDSVNKGELSTDGLSVGGIVADVAGGKVAGLLGKKLEAGSQTSQNMKNNLQREERMLSNRSDNKNAGNRPGRDARAQSDVNSLRSQISDRSLKAEMAGGAVGSNVAQEGYERAFGGE